MKVKEVRHRRHDTGRTPLVVPLDCIDPSNVEFMKYVVKKLGWTRQTIYRKIAQGILPHGRSESGYFVFRRSEIDAIAESMGRE